ncbi:hypothetical protein E8E13_008881 [Curvularia kusanoi]|uniref:Protein artemis n=1 Tax=Curvularia kusanoi TaxID=90978 RepID=A0A9P4WBC9_CURKU|nr:hypothetical protein E8E13_008881 [Curvularia kusanoi]
MEKFHYRVNFAKGILESRHCTYDRSMRKLAKPLPLDTPTTIELAPGNSIRVTLIDANHCVGAVMFLIEGNGKAVLYTGDIRAESWWVNSIVQNPVLAPYTIGLRRLDCIYLDTTFATKREPYKTFPSKADGIKELLEKVSTYPDDTIFYFHSWTFGYENVWVALSAFLESQIHLDGYRTRIYSSLSPLNKSALREAGFNVQSHNRALMESHVEIREAAALCGFNNGNHVQPGCLTSSENVRIHSCERAMGCSVLDNDKDDKVVHIIPIISRSGGIDIAELGAGGGKGDLNLKEELELGDPADIQKLLDLCAPSIAGSGMMPKEIQQLQRALDEKSTTVDLELQLGKESQANEDSVSLQRLIRVLTSAASKKPDDSFDRNQNKTIRFPYSRHSSYTELCELVAAFRPREVFPCTVDEATWTPELGMKALFGEFCSLQTFRHDTEMMKIFETRKWREQTQKRDRSESQNDTQFDTPLEMTVPEVAAPMIAKLNTEQEQILPAAEAKEAEVEETAIEIIEEHSVPDMAPVIPSRSAAAEEVPMEDHHIEEVPVEDVPIEKASALLASNDRPQSHPDDTEPRPPKKRKMNNARLAYMAAIGTHLTWADFGGLESTRNNEARKDDIL